MKDGNAEGGERRRGRRRRIVLVVVGVLVLGTGGFLLLGGLEAVVRWRLRVHLVGRVDVPDLRAGLTRVELHNGRLWEEARPDHVLLLAPEASAEVDLLRLRVPTIRLRGAVLDYRERISTGFVRKSGGRFPRIELAKSTVRLRDETILTAKEAVLERNEDREYVFRGTGLAHRGLAIDEVRLRLSEQEGGADVPAAVARLLGGQVTGTLSVLKDGRFEGRARAEGVRLEPLSVFLGSPTQTRFRGRVGAEVEIRGHPDDQDALRASGRVRVTELSIRDEPLLLRVLALLHGVASEETPFTEGAGRFEIEGTLLRVLEAEVLGPRWGLRGEGAIDLVGRTVDLEVVLVSRRGPPDEVPVEGGRLREVTEAFRERVARARIHGPFDRIRVTSVALEQIRGRMVEFVDRVLRRGR